MNIKIIGKTILLYTIAINIIKTDSTKTSELTESTELVELFKYEHHQNNLKEIQLKESDVKDILGDKPTGLQRTVLDLDFPEGAHNTNPKFRIIQCLAVGHIDFIQRKTYKNVALKLTPREPYDNVKTSNPPCTNTVIVSLSPPGSISATDNVLTNVYKIYQKKVTLKKDESQTLLFEDVLDSGFLKMDLFWVNFEITGRCSQYLQVDLLKPQNSSLYGDKDPEESNNSNPEGQQQQGSAASLKK